MLVLKKIPDKRANFASKRHFVSHEKREFTHV